MRIFVVLLEMLHIFLVSLLRTLSNFQMFGEGDCIVGISYA